MRIYDTANMLGAFDESFNILIKLMTKGEMELALIRARKMQCALHKVMGFLDTDQRKDDQKLVDSI